MKAFLVALLLTLSLQSVEMSPATDLIQGVFDGLNFNFEISSLENCITNMDAVLSNLISVIHDVKQLNPTNAISLLVEVVTVVQSMAAALEPCIESQSIIDDLEAILNVDLSNRISIILDHSLDVISLLVDVTFQAGQNNYYGLGMDIGKLVDIAVFVDLKENGNDAFDFLYGLFYSLNAHIDIKEVMNCMSKEDIIVSSLKLLVQDIKTTNWGNTFNVVMTLSEIWNFVQVINDDLKQCQSSRVELQQLIEEIMQINFNSMFVQILGNIVKLTTDCKNLITSVEGGNYTDAGVTIGDIINIVLLSKTEATGNELLDFLTGFFSIVDKNIDPSEVMDCMENKDDLIGRLDILISDIKDTNWNNILNVIATLSEVWNFMKKFATDLNACQDSIPELKDIVNKISHINIDAIIPLIYKNQKRLTNDCKHLISDVTLDNFTAAGFDVGDLVYVLVLSQSTLQDTSPLSFAKGLLEGLRVAIKDDNLINCVGNIAPMISTIKAAIAKLSQIDFKHLDTIIEGLQEIVSAVEAILEDLKPCIASPQDIDNILNAFKNINWSKIPSRVLSHIPSVVKDVSQIQTGFSKGDYETAGKGVGDLIYVIFLS